MVSKESIRFFHNSLEHLPNKHICLLQVGWEKCQPGYQYTNYRSFYLIHFVKSGKGTLCINDQCYTLNPNDAFLIRPDQLAVYAADQETPWEYYYFAFNGEMAPELVERSYFQNNGLIHHLKDDKLYHLIRDAALNMDGCDIPDIYGLQHLFEFLYQLMPPSTAVSDANDETTDSPQKYLTKAQEYIQFNYYKPIQVDDICRAVNVSRSYLFRIFRKYTNSDVENYLISIRLQQAKKLLRETDLSTANIARLVGYVNPTSFYRMFKRLEKITPSEWRAIHQNLIVKSQNGSIQEFSVDGSPQNLS